ncbi:hypothetical protein NKH18_50975 [Streptomyces sp. M10(2022)]
MADHAVLLRNTVAIFAGTAESNARPRPAPSSPPCGQRLARGSPRWMPPDRVSSSRASRSASATPT